MSTILLLVVLAVSFAGTFIIYKVAVKRNIMDVPNIRSSHSQPTPRGGGLALVVAWYIGLFVLRFLGLIESNLFFALLSGAILAIISFIDDLYDIKPLIRIVFQFITVASGLWLIGGLTSINIENTSFDFPIVLSCIALIGTLWFINLFNFLDGIDGYASVEAILVALGLLIITRNIIFLVLIFAVLGFLIWNWPRAKIFMGDIGSTQLGYILVILGIHFNNKLQIDFLGWLILTSLFWVDATVTLFKRWRNKEKLSQAHKKHYFQRIVQFGFSHRKTVIWAIAINLMFIGLVCLSEKEVISYFITFPLCLAINLILIKLIDARFPFNSSN
jgi:UDP-N-acetylmuramyl pentapeptide phosphotransferase/UDP-N-acetylglucosamine-1-phosphate transferase